MTDTSIGKSVEAFFKDVAIPSDVELYGEFGTVTCSQCENPVFVNAVSCGSCSTSVPGRDACCACGGETPVTWCKQCVKYYCRDCFLKPHDVVASQTHECFPLKGKNCTIRLCLIVLLGCRCADIGSEELFVWWRFSRRSA